MSPKKKGAKKGVREETDEQRALRLELEKQQADEFAQKRDEQNRIALRERQLKEAEYARLNGMKIHNQWRKIMRMSKVDELRRRIEIVSQNHEREVDRKDAIIQMLDRDLEDAEEQYQLALRGHMSVMEQLQQLQNQRMKAVGKDYERNLKILQEQFETEKNEIGFLNGRCKKDQAEMIDAMQGEFNDADAEQRQEFDNEREEVKNRYQEEYNILKIQLEGNIDDLERNFEQAHQTYMQSTEQRASAFRQLTKNDAQAARMIEKRMKKQQRLQEQLTQLRIKLTTTMKEWQERNRALRSEKDQMHRHYALLKGKMDQFRAQQQQHLKSLTINSGQTLQKLQTQIRHAEHILKLAEMCRKLETEEEKILPLTSRQEAVPVDYLQTEVPTDLQDIEDELNELMRQHSAAKNSTIITEVTDSDQTNNNDQVLGQDSEQVNVELSFAINPAPEQQAQPSGESSLVAQNTFNEESKAQNEPQVQQQLSKRMYSFGIRDDGEDVEEWQYLERFFRRYNKVLLDKLAADKERDRLNKENADLRAILKQYLDGISVNNDVINNPINPLCVVNNRLQVTLQERQKARQAHMASLKQDHNTELFD